MHLAPNILAQADFDWSNLLYLLIVFIFPALNALGEWIRKKSGKKSFGDEKPGNATDDYEVVIEDGQMVLRPAQTKPEPQSKPGPAPQPVAGPSKPTPIPQPVPAPKPVARRVEAPLPPQPRRPVPAPQPRPRPQRRTPIARPAAPVLIGESDTTSVFDQSKVEVEQVGPARTGVSPLLGEKLDRQTLRKAVILSEIVAPPLALRSYDQGPMSRPL